MEKNKVPLGGWVWQAQKMPTTMWSDAMKQWIANSHESLRMMIIDADCFCTAEPMTIQRLACYQLQMETIWQLAMKLSDASNLYNALKSHGDFEYSFPKRDIKWALESS